MRSPVTQIFARQEVCCPDRLSVSHEFLHLPNPRCTDRDRACICSYRPHCPVPITLSPDPQEETDRILQQAGSDEKERRGDRDGKDRLETRQVDVQRLGMEGRVEGGR